MAVVDRDSAGREIHVVNFGWSNFKDVATIKQTLLLVVAAAIFVSVGLFVASVGAGVAVAGLAKAAFARVARKLI